jgi:hypothetical protein
MLGDEEVVYVMNACVRDPRLQDVHLKAYQSDAKIAIIARYATLVKINMQNCQNLNGERILPVLQLNASSLRYLLPKRIFSEISQDI